MTVYDFDPDRLYRHGYTFAQVKEWRTQQLNAGKPWSLDDFYEAHGLCIDCHAAGRTVSGVRWRDRGSLEHRLPLALDGVQMSIASFAEREADALAWNYTYEICDFCGGTRKSSAKNAT